MTLSRVLNEETVQPQRSTNDGDAPVAWHRWQNGHVERVIGSIRRESLDRLVVFDEAKLRRVLKNYASYIIRSARISRWTRMRRIFGARKSSVRSQASQFNMPGFSF
jgi:hypothetical protein